jgi:hypothetical protein
MKYSRDIHSARPTHTTVQPANLLWARGHTNRVRAHAQALKDTQLGVVGIMQLAHAKARLKDAFKHTYMPQHMHTHTTPHPPRTQIHTHTHGRSRAHTQRSYTSPSSTSAGCSPDNGAADVGSYSCKGDGKGGGGVEGFARKKSKADDKGRGGIEAGPGMKKRKYGGVGGGGGLQGELDMFQGEMAASMIPDNDLSLFLRERTRAQGLSDDGIAMKVSSLCLGLWGRGVGCGMWGLGFMVEWLSTGGGRRASGGMSVGTRGGGGSSLADARMYACRVGGGGEMGGRELSLSKVYAA